MSRVIFISIVLVAAALTTACQQMPARASAGAVIVPPPAQASLQPPEHALQPLPARQGGQSPVQPSAQQAVPQPVRPAGRQAAPVSIVADAAPVAPVTSAPAVASAAAAVSAPPIVSAASAASRPPTTAPLPVARVPAVEFRLAQSETDVGLQRLQLGNRVLWMLPQPVLVRADLQTVAAVKSADGRDYVRFGFNPSATPKLADLSRRYPGKYLLLSIDGRLVSAPTIGGPATDGVLFVPMTSVDQARRVAAIVAGAPASPQP